MIYMAPCPCVMLLMWAAPLRGQVKWGWTLEIETFLGPVKWHSPLGSMPFHSGQKKSRFSRAQPSPIALVMDLPSPKALHTGPFKSFFLCCISVWRSTTWRRRSRRVTSRISASSLSMASKSALFWKTVSWDLNSYIERKQYINSSIKLQTVF